MLAFTDVNQVASLSMLSDNSFRISPMLVRIRISMNACLAASPGIRTAAIFLLLAIPLFSPAGAADLPRTVKPGEVLRGHFVQERQLAGFARPLRSEGTFVLIPGRGLIWRAQTPFQNTTVITPEGILQLTNGQEAMRLPAARMPGLGQLYDVLGGAVSGDIEPLGHIFFVKRNTESDGWQLVLTPLHPDNPGMSQIKSLTVVGRQFVDTVVVDKGGGDVDRLSFLDQAATTSSPTPEENSLIEALHK
jgi:hypothetical protein